MAHAIRGAQVLVLGGDGRDGPLVLGVLLQGEGDLSEEGAVIRGLDDCEGLPGTVDDLRVFQVGMAADESVDIIGEAVRVEDVDRRLILEDGGDVGGTAHIVPVGDEEGVRVRRTRLVDLAGQGLRTGLLDGAGLLVDDPFDVPVEVGDRKKIESHRLPGREGRLGSGSRVGGRFGGRRRALGSRISSGPALRGLRRNGCGLRGVERCGVLREGGRRRREYERARRQKGNGNSACHGTPLRIAE